jgi:putative redox protein
MAADEQPPEHVEVTETRAGRYQVAVDAGGAHFLSDEPAALGGLGSGPNPYDLLSAALGSCTAMTVRMYAEHKAWPLDRVKVRVLHARSALDKRDRFAREIVLEGSLDEAQRRRLLEIANRCPVHLTLERGADVITTLARTLSPDDHHGDPGQHLRDMAEACAD